jgi:hypothetical protein
MSCFYIIFSPKKLENKRAEQVLTRVRAGNSGRREVLGKGGMRMNTVQENGYT